MSLLANINVMSQHDAVTVLIVDDDPDIRRLLGFVLKAAGRRVLTAANGQEALTVLRSAPDNPCVILLDLMMPVMSGPEFRAAQLADPELSHIPVIVFSALGEVVEQARALGALAYMRKPFVPDKVVELLTCHCAPAHATAV
jgi:CheY-like chemotaxis protein